MRLGRGWKDEPREPRMVSKNQGGFDTSSSDDVVFGSRIAGLYRKMERGHNVGAIDASRSPIHPYWRRTLLLSAIVRNRSWPNALKASLANAVRFRLASRFAPSGERIPL